MWRRLHKVAMSVLPELWNFDRLGEYHWSSKRFACRLTSEHEIRFVRLGNEPDRQPRRHRVAKGVGAR